MATVKELIGQKFGKLTVIERAENSSSGQARWKCLCECGNYRVVCGSDLSSGHTKSCGCSRKNLHYAKDIKGKTFGWLTVIERAENNKRHQARWKCLCKCGNTIIVPCNALTSGNTQSCGCKRFSTDRAINLIGQKFGKLTVIERADNDKRGRAHWKCLCECGKYKTVCAAELKAGHTRSCGCLHKGKEATDIKGMRFGRLVVIERAGANKEGRIQWLCKCDCGNEKIISGKNLRNRSIESCGCLKNEVLRRRTIHGMTNTKLYKKWKGMKTRCNNPNRDHSQWYHEKDIKVCEEWNDFENFYKWAIENGYRDDLSIERIDINKGYEPSNCKWIAMKEQAWNKSNTHWITYDGKTLPLAKWADEVGIPQSVLQSRIKRYHWSIERALTEPVRKR